MTDAANVLSILDYITSAGEPVSGGSIEFYQAGTSTARTVYSDAALSTSLGTIVYTDSYGFPVSTQGGSTRVSIYTGTAAYKVVVKNSAGTTLFTRDNIPGALDTSGFTTTSALPTVPVSAKTAAYTITTSDRGYLFNANPTGGTFVLTLPSAVTAGNNFAVGIRHNGTANQVTIAAVSSQNIRGPGTPTSYFSLVGRGEEVWLASDGADWIVTSYTPALIRPGLLPPPLHITDRLTAAPSSPTAGARYIVNGTPTGTWSTLGFAQHDIAEADGNGSWTKYTPSDGWVAYVADETLLTQYRTSAWTDLSNITAPSSANLGYAIFADQKADGTVGGTATTAAWTKRTLNTTLANTITGCSLASSVVTLTTGTYLVWANAYQQRTNGAGISILQGASTRHYGLPGNTASDGAHLSVLAVIVIAGASDTIELDYYAQANSTTSDLGAPLLLAGNTETYAMLTILDLSSMQGPQGSQGTQGADGLDAAYPYQWSTSTSGDPGSGKVAGNNATIASITQLQISETDSAGGSMAAVIATWDDSTSTNRATVKISKEGATQNFHSFRITGAGTDAGTYWTFPVTYIATSGTISNADSCAVLVIEKGDKGDTGATGSAATASFDYTFSTTTTSGPSTGTIRANNATLSSATALYIHETDRLGISQASAIAQWDDSTTTAHRGYLTLVDVATPANKVRFEITGANTDNGSDQTITVTYVSGATSLTAVNVQVIWERTGDKGADGAGSGDVTGPSSSVNNEIVLFSGTTGKLIKSATTTGILKGTSGVISAASAGTDYYAPGSTDVAIADGGTGQSTATAGFDALAPTTTRGDLIARGASNNVRLAVGAANRILTSDGTDPAWSATINGVTWSGDANPTSSDGAALGTTALMWSDLFLASGGVINFNNGDVTITHSANALTFSGAASGYLFTDGAVACGDSQFYMLLSGGTLPVVAFDADDYIAYDRATNRWYYPIGGAISVYHSATYFCPGTNDALSLGLATQAWSDLFLASGGVINFNNGNVSLTHSAATLTLAGATSLAMGTSIAVGLGTIEIGHASDTTISRSAAGVIAVEGVPLYSNIPQNSQSAAYTTVLADAQKHILHPSADTTARTFTIDSNANVAYPIGTAITFVNQASAGVVTIAITSDTMRLAGAGTTGSRSLAANGIATALKITSTEWIISGTGLT